MIEIALDLHQHGEGSVNEKHFAAPSADIPERKFNHQYCHAATEQRRCIGMLKSQGVSEIVWVGVIKEWRQAVIDRT
ncbi:MAG: hypothetical protein AAGP08_00430 [Pseudomonadota bacterium]